MDLFLRSKKVTTPFALLGSNENALTYAFGFTLSKSPELLRWFLKEVGVVGVRNSQLSRAKVHLQLNKRTKRENSFTDIEIHLPGICHVIIEAKIGLAMPEIAQCQKYRRRLSKSNEPIQRLVVIVENADESMIEDYRSKDDLLADVLRHFNWQKLLPISVRLMLKNDTDQESRNWLTAFYDFLDGVYQMRSFTTEVWILPVNTEPHWKNGLSFWDMHRDYGIYFSPTDRSVRPLYIGFRVHGEMASLYRVEKIEPKRRVIELIPKLKDSPDRWPRKELTVWHLGKPVQLDKPLRSGAGMFNRRVRCDLDLVLSSETVKEVEEKMGKRLGR